IELLGQSREFGQSANSAERRVWFDDLAPEVGSEFPGRLLERSPEKLHRAILIPTDCGQVGLTARTRLPSRGLGGLRKRTRSSIHQVSFNVAMPKRLLGIKNSRAMLAICDERLCTSPIGLCACGIEPDCFVEVIPSEIKRSAHEKCPATPAAHCDVAWSGV